VDEALFLSDRIVMMTNGPEAEVGDILPVHFERPRDRAGILAHPDYYDMREYLITYLSDRSHIKGQYKASVENQGFDFAALKDQDEKCNPLVMEGNHIAERRNRPVLEDTTKLN
jgi:hypothetical protein